MTHRATTAGCGHEVLARGVLPGLTTLPGRKGTLCYPCADDVHRATMTDPNVRSYIARLNGATIISPFGGRLAEVIYRSAVPQFHRPLDTLWITDNGGRVWTARVDPGRRRGRVILVDEPGTRLSARRPDADTVSPGDTVEAWGAAYEVVAVSSVGATVISPASTRLSITQFVPWAAISAHTRQLCCIGPRELCRCVNGVIECPMSGCNGRATVVIDRLEYQGDKYTDTRQEKVCPEHYEVLITVRGWSTPARGIAE